jgi:hypothetical protein
MKLNVEEASEKFESWASGHFGVLNMGKVDCYYSNQEVRMAAAIWFMAWTLAAESCKNQSTNANNDANIIESEQS